MNFKTLILFCLIAAISSCRSRVNLQQGTFSGKHVRVGTEVKLFQKNIELVLVKDGRVFMNDLSGKYKEIHKMKRLHAWALLRTIKRSGIREKTLDEPGPLMTYFIQFNTNKDQYAWIWGKDGANPPEEIQSSVDELMDIMNKEKKSISE